LNFLLFATVKGLPILIFVIIVVRLATRQEQHYFQLLMASQGTDVASPEEMRELSDQRNRLIARRRVKSQKGEAAAKLEGQLQRQQIRYSMIATSDRPDRDSALAQQALLIRTLRGQIASIPDVPRPVPVVTPAVQPTAPTR